MFSLKMKVAILSMVIAVAASDQPKPCTRTRRGSIRLQGGRNSGHGRVELCLNRHWRPLCANHWEDADAQVACRELGFSATGAVAVSSGFVNTNYGRWLYRFKCYGDENRLIDCPRETAENCGPTRRDAGVRCTEACTHTRRGSIRLQGEQNSGHGRVELCLDRHWRPLCANHWEDADAQVACRELGFSATGAVAVSSGFVNTNYGRWLYRFKCYGDENRLIDCPLEAAENCGPTRRDAGVRCTEGSPAFVHLALQSSQCAIPPHNLSELELFDGDSNSTSSKKITVLAEVPDLTKLEFTTKNLVVKRGTWELYEKPNYVGTPNILNHKSGLLCTTSSTLSTQSVKPLMGQIILYEHSNYNGKCLVLTESAPDLRAHDWNDKTSSVRVISGNWSLYHNVGYENSSVTYAGTVSMSAIASANDAISSVSLDPN